MLPLKSALPDRISCPSEGGEHDEYPAATCIMNSLHCVQQFGLLLLTLGGPRPQPEGGESHVTPPHLARRWGRERLTAPLSEPMSN
jgi:hypothetical protein